MINLIELIESKEDVEDSVMELLKNGWFLVCMWFGKDCAYDEDENLLLGYFDYWYDTETCLFIESRNELFKDNSGNITMNCGDNCVSNEEQLLKNKIFNSYSEKSMWRNTYNVKRTELLMDDFFNQWTIDIKIPDKIVLFEKYDMIKPYVECWVKTHREYELEVCY